MDANGFFYYKPSLPFSAPYVEDVRKEVLRRIRPYGNTFIEFQAAYTPEHFDICLPYSDGVHSGLYIKLLRDESYYCSTLENEKRVLLRTLDNKCVICYSAKEALEEIRQYTLARYKRRMDTGSRRFTILYHKLISIIF